MARKHGTKKRKAEPKAENYEHKEADALLRPEIGLQSQFRQKKPPKTYRYDYSLSRALDWDGQNPSCHKKLLRDLRLNCHHDLCRNPKRGVPLWVEVDLLVNCAQGIQQL